MQTIQSILFDRTIYNLNKCLLYLKTHRLNTEMWATPKYFHFPQHETNKFQKYYTIKMYNGIYLVKGYGRFFNENIYSPR